MILKSITCYREIKMPGKVPYSSETMGASATIDVELGEDHKDVYRKAWLIVGDQVLGKIMEKYTSAELRKEKEEIDSQLGF